MFYYEIAPAGRAYQGQSLLTYSSENQLVIGQIVVVSVRTLELTAIVLKQVKKPTFNAKKINKVAVNYVLNDTQVMLMDWIIKNYPGGLGSTAGLFIPHAIPKKPKTHKKSVDKITSHKIKLPETTTQQRHAIDTILNSKERTHILHGDTGSGKTRVYIELTRQIIAQEKSIIILTPEISLTPQIAEQFNSVFDNVYITHSGLTQAERRDIWEAVSVSDHPTIVIGPRSALFYPQKNIGLIVVDEFHDGAYKQEQNPKYNAVRVAGMLSQISRAKLVLGSATPPIEEYFYAVSKGALVHRLTEKPVGGKLKNNVHIVDLSQKSEYSGHPLLSKTLLNNIEAKLNDKQQVLIFINKRGTSRLIMCQECGWYASCTRCNIPYTYHHDNHELVCHVCNQKTNSPNNCPDCGSANILFKNPGTKAISEALASIFKNAVIGRYDKDNKKNETFIANHKDISEGNVDILVGTQLLTKGHDLPKLGMVGILLAESNLSFPDYSSEENSFNMIHQIAGRVGRRDLQGEVILQTYNPNGSFSEYVKTLDNDWINFYSHELQQRRKYNFPPFVYLLKIEVARKSDSSSEKFAQKTADAIRKEIPHRIEVLGPSPAFIHKRNDYYHWHIIIKSKRRSDLIDVINMLPNGCTYNIDPDNLL